MAKGAKVYSFSLEKGNSQMTNRRRLITSTFVPLLIGLIALYNVTHDPRFAAIRSVDVVRLIASGMCFGVALVSVIALFRNPRTN